MANYYQPLPTRPLIPTLKGRPVASLEEARAMAIDFDGSIFYFPDIANKRIYTKQINLDGTSSLLMYELKEIPVEVPTDSSNFITRDEFNAAMSQIKALLNAEQEQTSTQPKPQTAEFHF